MAKIALFLFFISLSAACFSQELSLEEASAIIRSPQELSQWYLKDFKYIREMPDRWQPAEETLRLRQGDCEDYAILSHEILKRMGIRSQIIIIKFNNIRPSHIICAWKEGRYYNFFTNQHFVQTQSESLVELIEELYPDWRQLIFTNAQKQSLAVLNHKNIPATQ
ncbi:MAG: transglutaminase-like domain-containing protein [Candidatus Omnitrophota bacterium]